jgi:hypothetical protein
MIESHLKAGAQKFTPGKDKVEDLAYGQSITDACLAWDDSSLGGAWSVLSRKRVKGASRQKISRQKRDGARRCH